MEKYLKYFVLMLATVLSLSLSSCGGGDDDEPDQPASNKVYTATESLAGGYASFQLDDNIELAFGINGYSGSRQVYFRGIEGARICYISDANSLESIKEIPSSGWKSTLNDHWKQGGYIGEYTTSKGALVYIRMWVEFTYNASGEYSSVTVKWQRFKES